MNNIFSHILDVKNDNLKELIKTIQKPMIIAFWAPWCGPCRQVNPLICDLSEELDGRLKVLKVNIEENQQTAKAYKITSIPTLLLLDAKGRPLGDPIIGTSTTLAEEIQKRLLPHL